MYLFQYMICNTDWPMVASHNVKVMRIGTEYFPVPYDFDFSGLVNAPHAGPNPALADRQDSVRERVFRGFCSDGTDDDEMFGVFDARRHAILELIRTQPGLSQRNAATSARYIQEFYGEMDDPGRFKSMIRGACRR